jgi:hypothetical protein
MKRESELCGELGIPRYTLVAFRNAGHLGKSGWKRSANAVWITIFGERIIRERLASRIGIPEDALGPVEETLEPDDFKVTGMPRNPRLILCEGPGGGEIRVRVRSNENFVKGMLVKARPPAPDSLVWVLVGRSPRWRGKW